MEHVLLVLFDKKWKKVQSPNVLVFPVVLTRSGKKSKVQTFKVQTPHRRGSFLGEAHTGFHALNGLGFGLAQKVEGFAVGLIGIA